MGLLNNSGICSHVLEIMIFSRFIQADCTSMAEQHEDTL